MELKGKKINVLGDSITEGAGVSTVENTFWSRLGRATGATVRGYGIGGTRIAKQRAGDEWNLYFASRVEGMDPDADLILVFGGTNDYGHGDAPLGTMDSRDETSFYGGLHSLCQKLIAKYPLARIVLLTPLHRIDENRLVNEWGVRNVATLEGYRDAIRAVAAYYGLPVYNWDRATGMQPEIPEIAARYMPDGLHPNDDGHAILAECLQRYLENL